MDNREQQLAIIKELNDNRSKLSALFSLYNSSVIVAEENRNELVAYFEAMIDFKNEVSVLSNEIAKVGKNERFDFISANKNKIKKLEKEVDFINKSFVDTCDTYKIALKECGNLKSEYKHTISELCKQFKASVDDSTDITIIKGYKQQVKIIKSILDKIEQLISEYNVKKNLVEQDYVKFNSLYDSVDSLIAKFRIA